MSTRRLRHVPALALAACALALPGAALAGLEPPVPKHRAKEAAQAQEPSPGERVAQVALTAVGVPYRWGGTTPSGGFDCSGLVYWAYRHVGLELPHSSYALASSGRRASRSRMRPGDVLVFSGLGHVGLYVGGGRMVHAPYTGRRVEVVELGSSHYGDRVVGVRRFVRA